VRTPGKKIPVGVLGATGTVGQRFVERLAGHPWFEITALAASERSAGKSYAEAARWRLSSRLPDALASCHVSAVTDDLPCRAVFSALDSTTAREVEPLFAWRGVFVFSNASAHRMDEDVRVQIGEARQQEPSGQIDDAISPSLTRRDDRRDALSVELEAAFAAREGAVLGFLVRMLRAILVSSIQPIGLCHWYGFPTELQRGHRF